jgi:hypothetical protein
VHTSTRRYREPSLQDLQQAVEMVSEEASWRRKVTAPKRKNEVLSGNGDLFVPLAEWELLSSGCRQ